MVYPPQKDYREGYPSPLCYVYVMLSLDVTIPVAVIKRVVDSTVPPVDSTQIIISPADNLSALLK
jgi:hypothetical protein